VLFFLYFILLFLVLWAIVYAVLPTAARGVQGVASRITKGSQRFARVQRFVTYASKWRDYFPVALVVVVGLVATLWVTETFVDVAEQVHAKSTKLQALDTHIHDWAITERRAGATPFFVTMTIIGGPAGVATILVLVAIVLVIRRRWRWLVYVAITAGGGGLLNLLLKQYFERARPDVAEMLRRAGGYSFPSGHAMGSTVAFGSLAYLAYRVLPRWRWRAAAIAFAISLVLSVAASRVYLGVHWISDVGAGIFAGTAWITATTVAYETFRRIRGVRMVRAASSQLSALSSQGNRPPQRERVDSGDR
jgi:membrane-associated phospholipid phosphatase